MDPFLLFPSVTDEALPQALSADEFARLPAMRPLYEVPSLAVALSGGPDSMALCALTYEWAQARGISMHAITVDHALRSESAAEARRVGEWVRQYFPQAIHVILRRDPESVPATKLQERARHDRYELMTGYCRENRIGHLLLAHHQDDQAETFLFRLCKGSGLDGLAAMRPQITVHNVQMVRPFLNIGKETLVGTCHMRSLPFVLDPSNHNDQFARVRLRHVMGALAHEGLTVRRLAVTAMRLGRAREALEHFTDVTWQAALLPSDSEMLVFDLNILDSQPDDIRVRIMMRALTIMSAEDGYGPRLERVEDLTQQTFTESGFTRTTLHRCIVEKSNARGTLSVRREIV